MRPSLLSALVAASGAAAAWNANLAYLSPSRNHPYLAINTHPLGRRATTSNTTSQNGTTENSGTWVYPASSLNFTHGVASGDPASDSVILWTRLAPGMANAPSGSHSYGMAPIRTDDETEPRVRRSVCVEFRIATDQEMKDVVDSGRAFTSRDVDYTVKFEAQNLEPFTTYYYQFHVCDSDKTSTLGRTKTLPKEDEDVNVPIRMAFYSCARLEHGYFNAYSQPVRKDSVDYVVHLGDYIYEYKGDSKSLRGRVPMPEHETVTLNDYRTRYASYRQDEQLRNSHATFPWIAVWDDHELSDNSWSTGSKKATGDDFLRRKLAAIRAYYEWMPIRQVDMADDLRIWRRFSVGTLFDLIMLDTRLYGRGTSVFGDALGVGGNSEEIRAQQGSENRTILGDKQAAWLEDELMRSEDRRARWRVIGQQVLLSKMSIYPWSQTGFDLDSWEGYRGSRDRLLSYIHDNHIDNVVFLSGDTHVASAWDVPWDSDDRGIEKYSAYLGRGSVAVEFGVTSVSSKPPLDFLSRLPSIFHNMASQYSIIRNRPLQWQDLHWRGYTELSVGPETLNATFFGTFDPRKRSDDRERALATFEVHSGENRLKRGVKKNQIGGPKPKGGQVRGDGTPF